MLLKLPLLLRYLSKFRKTAKKLLIIKTDAIGDYILFRNFIEALKKSEQYKDYRIDLLGNELWQDLSQKYDSGYVDESIFIKPSGLYEAPLQTFKTGWKLFKNNYEIVLQPTYSRTLLNDGLAALTGAGKIFGFESDTERIAARYKKKTDKFYTHRLPLPTGVYFEFERSKLFFEFVLRSNISLNSTSIGPHVLNKSGIVIFAGAGVVKREWKKEDFLSLIILIKQHTGQPIYLAGSSAEIPIGNYLESNLPQQSVVNLIGKSDLPGLVELIAGCSLVVANETSAIHIAVATKTKSVCILGGGHFSRFAPYPESFSNAPLCVYHKMDCYYCNWNCIFKTAETAPYPCIANVTNGRVWQAIRPLLTS